MVAKKWLTDQIALKYIHAMKNTMMDKICNVYDDARPERNSFRSIIVKGAKKDGEYLGYNKYEEIFVGIFIRENISEPGKFTVVQREIKDSELFKEPYKSYKLERVQAIEEPLGIGRIFKQYEEHDPHFKHYISRI